MAVPVVAVAGNTPKPATAHPGRDGIPQATQPAVPAERIFGGQVGTLFRHGAGQGNADRLRPRSGQMGSNDIIATICPIYVNEKGEEVKGNRHGTDTSRPAEVKAKKGYAVGAITAKSVAAVDAFRLTFMKIDKDHLDPNDNYDSEWVGGGGTLPPVTVSGNGKPAIGVVGHADKDCSSFGLTFAP